MQGTAERRINVLALLSRRRRESVNNLAAEFGVSCRTIRNDVAQLSGDYPIYTVPGPGGGVFVMDDWYFGDSRLTREEEEFLFRTRAEANERDRALVDSILKKYRSQNRK